MLRRSEIVEGTHVGGEMVHQIKENETSKARDLLRKSPTGFKRGRDTGERCLAKVGTACPSCHLGHKKCPAMPIQACAGRAGTQGRNLSSTFQPMTGGIETGGVLGARRGRVGAPLVLGDTSAAAGSMRPMLRDGQYFERVTPVLLTFYRVTLMPISVRPRWHCRRARLPLPPQWEQASPARWPLAHPPNRRRGRGSG